MVSDYKIHLHLGAHKTASTHIQSTLHRNQDKAAKSGVSLLLPTHLRGEDNALNKVFFGRSPNAIAKARAELDAAAGGQRLLAISEENYLGEKFAGPKDAQKQFYDGAGIRLERFVKASGGRDLTVFLAIRNPAALYMSLYAQHLMSGYFMDFDTFVQDVDLGDPIWEGLMKRLTRAAPEAQFVVWRQEDYAKDNSFFFDSFVGPKLAGKLTFAERRAHVGLSQKAVTHILRCGEFVLSEPDPGYASELRKKFPASRQNKLYRPYDAAMLKKGRVAYWRDIARIGKMPRVRMISPAKV